MSQRNWSASNRKLHRDNARRRAKAEKAGTAPSEYWRPKSLGLGSMRPVRVASAIELGREKGSAGK